jgi:UDP-N-acetylglucosamine transferase subunit ALG13
MVPSTAPASGSDASFPNGSRLAERNRLMPDHSPVTELPTAKNCALDRIPAHAKILYVTSTGGHLSELDLIDERVAGSPDSLWVTFETDQSIGFLEGRRHTFVDYVAPRDLAAALKAARRVAPLIRREKFDACISTGAAVAATILPMTALAGIPTYYVESLARPTGPSFTGKLLARAPRVRTLTQYREWASDKWPYAGSTLDGWRAHRSPRSSGPLNILVTLGTIAPYRFDRAVDAVLKLLVPGDAVTWQLGATTRTGLPGRVVAQVSPQEMETMSREADVVVAHSGVGSVLQQFYVGKSPVLAVRRGLHHEHVDDHQLGFAEMTARRGLCTVLDLAQPSRASLEFAAARVVSMRQQPAPIIGVR